MLSKSGQVFILRLAQQPSGILRLNVIKDLVKMCCNKERERRSDLERRKKIRERKRKKKRRRSKKKEEE